jgi:uncharacterized membrane protein
MLFHKLSLSMFLATCVLCVIHVVYYYPQLPDRVACHFGLGGNPDGWSSKTTFLGTYLIAVGVCSLLMLVVAYGLPYIPVSLVNLPNKDYWFSPERKWETCDFLSHHILWLGTATMFLLFDVMHQAFQVHLGRANALQHPMLSLGLYIGFTTVWCVALIVRFRKRKPE